jgi:hypothetical protein
MKQVARVVLILLMLFLPLAIICSWNNLARFPGTGTVLCAIWASISMWATFDPRWIPAEVRGWTMQNAFLVGVVLPMANVSISLLTLCWLIPGTR